MRPYLCAKCISVSPSSSSSSSPSPLCCPHHYCALPSGCPLDPSAWKTPLRAPSVMCMCGCKSGLITQSFPCFCLLYSYPYRGNRHTIALFINGYQKLSQWFLFALSYLPQNHIKMSPRNRCDHCYIRQYFHWSSNNMMLWPYDKDKKNLIEWKCWMFFVLPPPLPPVSVSELLCVSLCLFPLLDPTKS